MVGRSVPVFLALLLFGRADAQPPGGLVTQRTAFENPQVKVTVMRFPPGSTSGRHSGVESEMGIVVEGELMLVSPAGREVLTAGMVYFLQGLTVHDALNEGVRPATLWVVLLKRCD